MTRLAAAAALALACAAPAGAQSRPVYVPFTPGAVKGVLYTPDAGPAPHVAVLVIHRTSNFLAHLATTELAARGFMVLAIIVEVATHGIRPCTACERTPGQYSNTVRNFFDYVQRWIKAHD